MNIVVVAPHPDDAELGMGGSIARFVREGHRVLIVDMTDGEPTPCGTPERRATEAAAADAVGEAAHRDPEEIRMVHIILGLVIAIGNGRVNGLVQRSMLGFSESIVVKQ